MRTLFETLSSSNVDDGRQNIFVIIKPGFLNGYVAQAIIKEFTDRGWKVERTRTKRLLLSEAKRLYDIHKKEDWFDDLCKYMSSDLSMGVLFTKDKPMSKKMFDETNKIKDIVRKKFGESEMRNAIHSSDSLERLQIERGIYF